MQLHCPALDQFVPDGVDLNAAAARTTHLGIGAHPDDLEIIAIPGILAAYGSEDTWFTGVVACNGAGSPRAGRYAELSDTAMAATRRDEQRQAAALGCYSLQLQLGFSSAEARSADLVDCLEAIVLACRPTTLFLHNLADAHATHRALARSTLSALRQLPAEVRPEAVYGVEVWRSLDWLPERFRVTLPIDDPDGLQARLLRCHDSQISGGKRYDTAILARQQANATLAESHGVDTVTACLLAMDLAPLLESPDLETDRFLAECLEGFRVDLGL